MSPTQNQSDTPERPACCPLARNLGRISIAAGLALAAAALLVAVGVLRADDKKPEENKPPEGAVVLFDGKDLSKWQKRDGGEVTWKLVEDGAMEITKGGGDIITRDKFTDCTLHIEFMPPNMPEATGQGKGNSGVYMQDAFEIQVLDSYGLPKLEMGDCASIYGIKIADKNVAKPPAQWQTYDIKYKAPKLAEDGTITEPAEVTVYWNGEKVHDKVKVDKVGGGGNPYTPAGGPIRLQDHGNPVRYRNIWIVPEGKKDEGKEQKKEEAKPESK